MLRPELKTEITKIVLQISPDACFTEEQLQTVDLIDDLSLDSISFVTLIIELEDHFDIIISDDDLQMMKFRKIDDIVDIVHQLLYNQK